MTTTRRFSIENVRADILGEWESAKATYENLAGQPYDEFNGTAQLPVDLSGVVPRGVAIEYGALRGLEKVLDYLDEQGWKS